MIPSFYMVVIWTLHPGGGEFLYRPLAVFCRGGMSLIPAGAVIREPGEIKIGQAKQSRETTASRFFVNN
jgi:hypothetical protein